MNEQPAHEALVCDSLWKPSGLMRLLKTVMHKHAPVLDKPIPELKEYSVEQGREALQGRWDMFMSFKPNLRKALKNASLDEVNNDGCH